jgi:hypothetical protein
MKRWILTLVAALLAAPGGAADAQFGNFTFGYDVASATLNYCVVEGRRGDPYDTTGTEHIAPDFDIQIDGAGNVADAGTNGAFAAIVVGDTLILRAADGDTSDNPTPPDVETWVVTKSDDNTITVGDTSADANYRSYFYKKLACGTGPADGWVSVMGKAIVQFGVQYDAGDVTALAATWECKSGALGAEAIRVYPGVNSDCGDGTLNGAVCEFDTVGQRLYFKMANNAFAFCRIGLAWVTADGGTVDEITAVIDVGN